MTIHYAEACKGDVSSAHREVLRRIDRYDMTHVHERLVSNPGWTTEKAEAAIDELRRFFALTTFGNDPLAMIGESVDEAWHQFILFTESYQNFCDSVMGRFISHTPNTTNTPVPIEAAINFVHQYKSTYGELPAIWFDDPWPGLRKWCASPDIAAETPKRWSGWLGPRPQ